MQPVTIGMRFEIDEMLFEEVCKVLEVGGTQYLLIACIHRFTQS